MAFDPAANAGPPLDEIQWHTPPQFEAGIHSNSILYYFAQSPFYDKTSNNEVVFQQGLNNQAMSQYLATRELFESRLREMSGLEFIVAQEPAETGPGMGTGVWVINKQTRRKRPPTNPARPEDGPPDEIIVHSVYFVVGENIYMAPTLADVLSSRIGAIATAITKTIPLVDEVSDWAPAVGRRYITPAQPSAGAGAASGTTNYTASRTATPLPDGLPSTATTNKPGAKAGGGTTTNDPLLDSLLMEEALLTHERYGTEYMDENPITGKPGDFHLTSTGRKTQTKSALTLKEAAAALPALNTKGLGAAGSNPLAKGAAAAAAANANAVTGKETKSPKTPGGGGPPKPKRRKSKNVITTPGAA
ncbi:mediator of RNA polymerase II transcription subunit 6 [Neurospora hispaniola]|uniref:Mediator of RNA polymerase II transcription subunit 6 n=1 Tax=Neurospora hispaniola TaxID=588809 RepID=A0AAJ0IFF3_9PEZI|nr:mediator of RNA polymerase II transcription subunit 6 [Neurospora hispaniola]